MMKYGFNDYEWRNNFVNDTALTEEVLNFSLTFRAFMKRKTAKDSDMKAIEAMEEMIKMMREHAEEVRK